MHKIACNLPPGPSSLLLNRRVRFAVDIRVGGQGPGRRGVGAAQEEVGDPTRLAQAGQQRPVHRGRVVAYGVLPAEKDSRRVFEHVVAFARVAGDNRRGKDVVVVAG